VPIVRELQKVSQKKNSRVDCAEAGRKTVQAMRYEGRGFLPADGCPAELPVINLEAKPDRFLYFSLYDLLLLAQMMSKQLQYLIYFV